MVVIPGVLGSRLIEAETGRVVWGAFGSGAADATDPEDARLLAVPMRRGVPHDWNGVTFIFAD